MTNEQIPSEAMRLNKALARAGVCSRRKADELIFAGRVAVNGEIVTEPGRRVDPAADELAVDGTPVGRPRTSTHLTIKLHKPIEVVTTLNDPQGRPTVFDLLPKALRRQRPVPAGRLDFFSEGLLLLSTDGELVHRLTHPSHHLPKVYEVLVRGEVTETKLAAMRSGLTLAEGEELAGIKAAVAGREAGDRTLLRLTLVQGVNRQIRRMCRDLDWTVLRLVRVSQGPVKLGELAPGKWVELDGDELARLKKSLAL